MQFSGKITNSVLAYLTRVGQDRERLFDLTDVPLEFLRDPTSWIPAADVENFLRATEREFRDLVPELISEAGHVGSELRAWGVLDSVLKMMPKPQDIFAQPHRFISYFVSPAPPILNLKQTGDSVSFDLPIAHPEYPLTVAYLSAALEGLPRYWCQEGANVTWRQTTVRISWSNDQGALLIENPKNPKPELVESLVRGVEMAQAQGEAKDLEIARLESQLRELQFQLTREQMDHLNEAPTEQWDGAKIQASLKEVREHVLRLNDYLTRCQQALIVARMANVQNAQVQAVLRRIDWEQIRTQAPWLQLQCFESLAAAERLLTPGRAHNAPVRQHQVSLKEILADLASRFTAGDSKRLKIQPKSFVAMPMTAHREKIEVAIWQILSVAARGVNHRGEIELLARCDGREVEIVVVEKSDAKNSRRDELPLLTRELVDQEEELTKAAELLAPLQGQVTVEGELIGSRRFVCRWQYQEGESHGRH